MEVEGGRNNKFIVCIYEAIGTAFLINSMNWCGKNSQAIGLTYFANVMMFGPVSGGHFNPAITFGVLI